MFVSRGEEAKISDLDKAFWQYMLKEAVDERKSGRGHEAGFVGVGILVFKGDLIIF
jgi:hypothetical protein